MINMINAELIILQYVSNDLESCNGQNELLRYINLWLEIMLDLDIFPELLCMRRLRRRNITSLEMKKPYSVRLWGK